MPCPPTRCPQLGSKAERTPSGPPVLPDLPSSPGVPPEPADPGHSLWPPLLLSSPNPSMGQEPILATPAPTMAPLRVPSPPHIPASTEVVMPNSQPRRDLALERGERRHRRGGREGACASLGKREAQKGCEKGAPLLRKPQHQHHGLEGGHSSLSGRKPLWQKAPWKEVGAQRALEGGMSQAGPARPPRPPSRCLFAFQCVGSNAHQQGRDCCFLSEPPPQRGSV